MEVRLSSASHPGSEQKCSDHAAQKGVRLSREKRSFVGLSTCSGPRLTWVAETADQTVYSLALGAA